ncbi:MAG: PhzF family phenazine biosynthesis protein [Acidimicrobiia bacterium]|nr:PhzF family phenazine biosynthesis protein [Acidimicrobiia bacterium]
MSEVRRFLQVDVFGERPLLGNPVAVVLDAEGLDDAEMAAVARWTNLSETTFVLPPTDEGADYRVRIFTPGGELPFAGHPTLGTCHAWLQATGEPRLGVRDATVVQQCGIGLVQLRVGASGTLAFAAPEPVMSELSGELMGGLIAALGVDAGEVSATRVIDNGPNWHVLLLSSSDVVRRLRPDMAALAGLAKVGVVGPHRDGGDAQFELRAFAPSVGVPEDPVTGSLNAGVAQWLIGEGLAPRRYTATQGSCIGRAGRIEIEAEPSASGHDPGDTGDTTDTIWVGGATVTIVDGNITV